MIKMQVIGHLGKDAISNVVNEKTVINFSVAHSEKFKNAQGVQQERSVWVDCSWWSDRTNILPYLKKGTQVHIDGQPDVRSYTTKEGIAGASLICRVQSLQLLGSSNGGQNTAYSQANTMTERNYGGNQQQGNNTGTNYNDIPPTDNVDDLPF